MARTGRGYPLHPRLGRPHGYTTDICAFQADAFQNDAFQVCIISVSTKPGKMIRAAIAALRRRPPLRTLASFTKKYGKPTTKPPVRRPKYVALRLNKPAHYANVTGYVRKTFGRPTLRPPVRRIKVVALRLNKPAHYANSTTYTKKYGRPTANPKPRRLRVRGIVRARTAQTLTRLRRPTITPIVVGGKRRPIYIVKAGKRRIILLPRKNFIPKFGRPTAKTKVRKPTLVRLPRRNPSFDRLRTSLRRAGGGIILPSRAIFLVGPDIVIYEKIDFARISSNIIFLHNGTQAKKITSKVYMTL